MANARWQSNAGAIAQVNTLTVGGAAALGQIYSVTINTKVVSYTATGADSNTTIATNLTTNLTASQYPEFQEVVWTNPSAGVVVGTARTPGTPFTQISGATGTGTLNTALTVVNTGPFNWDNVNNWSTGAIPTNGDTVFIENTSAPILYGLAQSGVTLAALNIAASFTGTIGNGQINQLGYQEYRPQYLAIGATLINIGDENDTGSGRIKIDTGSTVVTGVVRQAAHSPDGIEAIIWKGTNAGNVWSVTQGSFGAAIFGGEVATIATLNVGQISSSADVSVRCSQNVTLTTVNCNSGSTELASNVTTINKKGGNLLCRGTMTVGTLTDDSGTTTYNSSGTLTTLTLGNNAAFDASQDLQTKTITNTVQMYAGATLNDPFAVLVFGGNPAIKLNRCKVADVTLDVGPHRGLTIA